MGLDARPDLRFSSYTPRNAGQQWDRDGKYRRDGKDTPIATLCDGGVFGPGIDIGTVEAVKLETWGLTVWQLDIRGVMLGGQQE